LNIVQAALIERHSMTKQKAPRSFRPWQENEERLQYAEKLGFELNTFLNELVKADEAKQFLERIKEERAKVLAAPVP
jgi:hypothetical protein